MIAETAISGRNSTSPASNSVSGQVPRARASRPAPPRLALRPEEAAASIGISRDLFDAEVLPELRVVRIGRLRLVPVASLERWLERNAALPLEVER